MNPDTDSDGKSDGAEIRVLKDWLANRRSGPPYETPWPDWPPQRAGCEDKDHDSIPNLAERWELGLLMDLESSDHDKFDDGQELFGVTYCPGGDLSCNYGDLPRSSDSGYVGATMPAWGQGARQPSPGGRLPRAGGGRGGVVAARGDGDSGDHRPHDRFRNGEVLQHGQDGGDQH